MKIKFLQSVSSFLLAILILLSTSSFTIKKHFCSGFLVDSAVFAQVERCAETSCFSTSETSVTQPDCCDDEVHLIEGQEVVTSKKIDDLDYEQQLVWFTLSESYFHLFESMPAQLSPHRDYIPPILVADIQILHQDFLI